MTDANHAYVPDFSRLGVFEPCEKCEGEGYYWNRTGATEAELERCEVCNGEGGWWVMPPPSYTITDAKRGLAQ